MARRPDWVRAAVPSSNPAQTDRSRRVLPFDPEGNDPFIMLAEDWFSTTGFDWHPHRGFETVTVVLDGVLEHRDNVGGHGILHAGDVQWTTTGRGVLHTEIAHQKKGVHTLQLWLNLPARLKMTPPRYQDLRGSEAPVAGGDGAQAKVFSGKLAGTQGKAENLWPTLVADLRLEAGSGMHLDVPAGWTAFAYVTEGSLAIGGEGVPEAHVAWFKPEGNHGDGLDVTSSGGGRAMLFAGPPIREPVVTHGPFVMNKREELAQAVRDYQSGAFGPMPAR